MRFAASQHQAKARPFLTALAMHGHELVAYGADVFLIDLDLPQYQPTIDVHRRSGAKIFVYPHGGTPTYFYDGIHPWDEDVTAHFVIGEGHREVLRRMGVQVPAYAI